ncbi:P-type DNA transfer ATPase VirB11 [Trinickia symbiotica]|uniref:Type IV secretion system protein n=1 Tax=Trinickia symbiotica TaxID=863227 RepID=A0A2T3XKA3_9BURK|nr:P-type DNA transfer ATPase VirB11 [Trinickia symbiotica]PTB16968.1 P-type DNA transfer ATPase VirB11 [Trinickia symbiotica]
MIADPNMPNSVPDATVARLPDDASVHELMRPFAPLLDDADVTELVINQPQRVLTETHRGWHSFDYADLDYDRLMSFAVAVATLTNQEISAQHPVLSALLPGDARIQVVVPPVVPPRTVSITIRRPSAREKTLDDYRNEGLFDETVWRQPDGLDAALPALRSHDRRLVGYLQARDRCGFFELAVRERLNIVIMGNTGSGKTSFMKTLCRSIPISERIVTIQDVRELFLPHIENCVHLTYSKGGHGQAQVAPADLIASAMRMRPDRVLLAELRGAEAYDFLKLLTTGHAGSITSYHAPNATVAVERFALMAKEHPEAAAYDDAALKRLLFLAIDVVAHMEARSIFDEAGEQVGKRWAMTEIWFDPVRKLRTAIV